MVVVLEREGEFVRTCGVRRADVVSGGTGEFDVVLREDAVVEDGNMRRASEFAGCIEARAMPDDVVGLPLARSASSVYQRRILAVNRGDLAVGVSLAVVRIKNLNFVKAHQEDAAVAAVLVFALGRIGLTKFDVELAIAKTVLGADVASLGRDFKVAVFDLPLGGAAILLLHPFGKVFAVEEDNGVRRRLAGCVLRASRAGSNDRRVGGRAVVDFSFGVDFPGAGGCRSSD